MALFTYKKKPPLIRDDLGGVETLNDLIHNIRYLGEDLFFIPDSTADKLNIKNYSQSSADSAWETYEREVGDTVGKLGVGVSDHSGTDDVTSLSYVDVLNLSVTLETVGRPVIVSLTGRDGDNNTRLELFDSSSGSDQFMRSDIRFQRDGTTISEYVFAHQFSNPSSAVTQRGIPASSVKCIDTPIAGEHTYTFQAKVSNASYQLRVHNCRLFAYEV